jgi:hypothetical protein
MEHKFNCLIFLCTCDVQKSAEEDDDKPQDTGEFFAILDGIDQFVEKGEGDV